MTNVHKYEQGIIKLAAMIDALAHPTRLQILIFLSAHKSCPAGNISDHLPVSKSTVSKHMSKLKDAGLISCKPRGICLDYQINDKILADFKKVFFDFIQQIETVRGK